MPRSASQRFATTESKPDVPWIDANATHKATRWLPPHKPAVCEPDNAEAVREFMLAMQNYKQSSGRMFPTWCEVLEVLKDLGYQKPGEDA
jgi:hypothetical protein